MRDNASCCAHSPRSWRCRIVLACLCVFPILLFLLAPTEGVYTYTMSDGEATITLFDTSYSCELSITNELGGVPVTAIARQAFARCFFLTDVTIPDGVTDIGQHAFFGCTNITAITIPASVTNINDHAFYLCISLTNITVSGSNPKYADIGDSAFKWCASLTDIYFCGDVPSAGTNLFSRTPATVYRMQGKAGWPDVPDPWQGLPTALWNPPEQER